MLRIRPDEKDRMEAAPPTGKGTPIRSPRPSLFSPVFRQARSDPRVLSPPFGV